MPTSRGDVRAYYDFKNLQKPTLKKANFITADYDYRLFRAEQGTEREQRSPVPTSFVQEGRISMSRLLQHSTYRDKHAYYSTDPVLAIFTQEYRLSENARGSFE